MFQLLLAAAMAAAMAAVAVAATPLCYVGCFPDGGTYIWDGCTLDNSIPQCDGAACFSRTCLYLNNARLEAQPGQPPFTSV